MNTTASATCKCNCGQTVGPKATYRPGHDARHVSDLLVTIIEHQEFDMVAQYQADLPSVALRAKFAKAVENHLARQSKKATRAKREVVEIVEYAEGIKIGRWVYPAREIKYSDDTSLVQRNAKRNGSGEWIDLEG